MTEICPMTRGHKYWNATVALVEQCSWNAGPYLAEKGMSLPNGNEKYGFEKLGDYETIYGSVDQLFVRHSLERGIK